jgi:hypothetical protein
VSVFGDTLIGAALVSAEGSNQLLGAEVVAVVTRSEEKTVVPCERGKCLVPVLDGLDGFHDSSS